MLIIFFLLIFFINIFNLYLQDSFHFFFYSIQNLFSSNFNLFLFLIFFSILSNFFFFFNSFFFFLLFFFFFFNYEPSDFFSNFFYTQLFESINFSLLNGYLIFLFKSNNYNWNYNDIWYTKNNYIPSTYLSRNYRILTYNLFKSL